MMTGPAEARYLASRLALTETELLHQSDRYLVLRCTRNSTEDVVFKACLGSWKAEHRDGFRREVMLSRHLRERRFPTLEVLDDSGMEQDQHLWMLTRYLNAPPWSPEHGMPVAQHALSAVLNLDPGDRPDSRYFRWDIGGFAWYAHRCCHSLEGLGDRVCQMMRHRVWDLLGACGALLDGSCRFLAHGDFSANQILVTDGYPTVFDWEHANQNNCALDAGHLYVNLYVDAPDKAEEWHSVAKAAAPGGEPFDDLWHPAVVERALGKMNAAKEDNHIIGSLTTLLKHVTELA